MYNYLTPLALRRAISRELILFYVIRMIGQHTKKLFFAVEIEYHLICASPPAFSESRGRRCLILHHSLVSWPSALSCKHLSCCSAHPSAAVVIVFIDTFCLWHIGVMHFPQVRGLRKKEEC